MNDEQGFDDIRSSRRDILKKAGVGAAIVWSAPVVSSVVTPAAASTPTDPGDPGDPGGECDTYYILKIDDEGCDSNQNKNFPCTSELAPGGSAWAAGCDVQSGFSFSTTSVSVTLPGSASNILGYVKTGSGDDACQPASTSVSGTTTKTVVVTAPEISHVVVTFCLPDPD